MSLPTIDVRSLSISDIQEALDNTGYIILPDEWYWTIDNDAFKYIGYDSSAHSHRYLVGFEGDFDGGYGASVIYLYWNKDGRFEAEYEGCTHHEGHEDSVLEYIENTCN